MCKMPRLRENDRVQAPLVLLALVVSVNDVARQFNCHRKTVIDLQQSFQQPGSVRDAVCSGRHKVTAVRKDRYVTLTHLRKMLKTARNTSVAFSLSGQ